MNFVIDASVAAKWFVPEAGTNDAEALLGAAAELIAPELLFVEVANFLWKAARTGRVKPARARRALAMLPRYVALTSDRELVPAAFDLARTLDHPVYDCLYLALAGARDARLITADERLLGKASEASIGKRIVSLTEAAQHFD